MKMDSADKIKFLREKILDMTQVELAKRLCVSRTSVHNWENGVSKPSTENIDYSLVIAPVVAELCTTSVALSAPPNSYQNNSQS